MVLTLGGTDSSSTPARTHSTRGSSEWRADRFSWDWRWPWRPWFRLRRRVFRDPLVRTGQQCLFVGNGSDRLLDGTLPGQTPLGKQMKSSMTECGLVPTLAAVAPPEHRHRGTPLTVCCVDLLSRRPCRMACRNGIGFVLGMQRVLRPQAARRNTPPARISQEPEAVNMSSALVGPGRCGRMIRTPLRIDLTQPGVLYLREVGQTPG